MIPKDDIIEYEARSSVFILLLAASPFKVFRRLAANIVAKRAVRKYAIYSHQMRIKEEMEKKYYEAF